MNNNPNENLEQTQNNTVENVNSQVNSNAVNTVTANVSSTGTEGAVNPSNGNPSVVDNTALAEQRVNLVNNKPTIKSIVPNNPVSNVKQEEKVEELTPAVENVTSESISTENVSDDPKRAGKNFFLILLFGILFGVVFFLPDISKYVETQKYMKTHVEEKITEGVLKCKYEDSTDTLDYNYLLKFSFSNNRLDELEYLLEIRGDATEDADVLNERKMECDQISSGVESLKGISVSCSLSNGLYKQKQIIDYASVNKDTAMSAYTEAGGIYPDYENAENIDDIERNMNASGYTCERIKSLT